MGMAQGGLMSIPIPDAMYDEPDNGGYRGGGIVAFQGGGAVYHVAGGYVDEAGNPAPEPTDTDTVYEGAHRLLGGGYTSSGKEYHIPGQTRAKQGITPQTPWKEYAPGQTRPFSESNVGRSVDEIKKYIGHYVGPLVGESEAQKYTRVQHELAQNKLAPDIAYRQAKAQEEIFGGAIPTRNNTASAAAPPAATTPTSVAPKVGSSIQNPITLTKANQNSIPDGAFFRTANGDVRQQKKGAGYSSTLSEPPVTAPRLKLGKPPGAPATPPPPGSSKMPYDIPKLSDTFNVNDAIEKAKSVAPQLTTTQLDAAEEYYKGEAGRLSKRKKEDLWTTLAQIGFGMAASKNPQFLGAVGEAASAAIPGMVEAAKSRRTDEREAMKARADIEAHKNEYINKDFTNRTAIAGLAQQADKDAKQFALNERELTQRLQISREEIAAARDNARLAASTTLSAAKISNSKMNEFDTIYNSQALELSRLHPQWPSSYVLSQASVKTAEILASAKAPAMDPAVAATIAERGGKVANTHGVTLVSTPG